MYPKVKIEAPVKDLRSAKIALKTGADIIYAGIKGWSIRPNIFELTKEEFPKIIKMAKSYQKEVLLVMNCFYNSREFSTALSLIEEMAREGIDGVIVSQLSLAKKIRQKLPHLHIHISVQTSASNNKELELYKKLGVESVVLPRNLVEISAENVKRFNVNGVKISAFIIGDDITNYDGRCFLSSYINQKMIKDQSARGVCAMGSANRSGYCFLMCKRKCEYIRQDKSCGTAFYLRKKDMALFLQAREMIKAGVSIFKIQGREWPTPLVARFIRKTRLLLDSLEDEKCYQRTLRKLLQLVKIKQQIQANHLWLLAKSNSAVWLKCRKYLQGPLDNLETMLWLYLPFFGSLRWKKFQKENQLN